MMSLSRFSIRMLRGKHNSKLHQNRSTFVSPGWMRPACCALFTLVIVLAAAQTDPSQQPQQSPTPLQTNTSVDRITTRLEHDLPALMKAADVPGLSIALVRKGNVAWVRPFGVKD